MFIVKTDKWSNLLTDDCMIFTYNLKDRKIVIPRETTFKEHNILEKEKYRKMDWRISWNSGGGIIRFNHRVW